MINCSKHPRTEFDSCNFLNIYNNQPTTTKKTIKYARLLRETRNSNLGLLRAHAGTRTRVRKIASVDDIIKTSRSLKRNLDRNISFTPNYSPATKRKILTIPEDEQEVVNFDSDEAYTLRSSKSYMSSHGKSKSSSQGDSVKRPATPFKKSDSNHMRVFCMKQEADKKKSKSKSLSPTRITIENQKFKLSPRSTTSSETRRIMTQEKLKEESNRLNIKSPSSQKSYIHVQAKVNTFLHRKSKEQQSKQDPTTLKSDKQNERPKSPQKKSNDILKYGNFNLKKEKNLHTYITSPKPESSPKSMEDKIIETDIGAKENQVIQTENIMATTKLIVSDLSIPELKLINSFESNTKCFSSKSLPNLNIPNIQLSRPGKTQKENTSILIDDTSATNRKEKPININSDEPNNSSQLNDTNKQLAIISPPKSIARTESDSMLMKISTRLDKRSKNIVTKISEILKEFKCRENRFESEAENEQFMKELKFIDSFFESLALIENSKLSKNIEMNVFDSMKPNCFVNKIDSNNKKIKQDNNIRDSFQKISEMKMDNDKITNEKKLSAAKCICLINLMLKDEQRMAKNLLLVLKMREDAIKDFTKSQILWLENKKKNQQVDVSVLKKKQRGALIKLQQECGEMQRMKKALLAISQKRKAALMQTKKSLELRIRNKSNLDNNKSLKRNTPYLVEKKSTPLKCFSLSSSNYGEDSPSSVKNEETMTSQMEINVDTIHNEEHKNFVTVDGGYLNILLKNKNLPEIFSETKEYEVKEHALNNLLTTTNIVLGSDAECQHSDRSTTVIEKASKSTTPSTARSLVDEYEDMYASMESEREDRVATVKEIEYSANTEPEDDLPQYTDKNIVEQLAQQLTETFHDSVPLLGIEKQKVSNDDLMSDSETVKTAIDYDRIADLSVMSELKVKDDQGTSNEYTTNENQPNISDDYYNEEYGVEHEVWNESTAAEAEELRQQQLKIEMEIKALEQCGPQLYARQIPDKPPPPYTPPVQSSKQFVYDTDNTIQYVQVYCNKFLNVSDEDNSNKSSCVKIKSLHNMQTLHDFDQFLYEYCQESVAKYKANSSHKPWSQQCLVPPKKLCTSNDVSKMTELVNNDLQESLRLHKTESSMNIQIDGQSRRLDYIDDILIKEWKRFEHEWTCLESDEVNVKNQVYEKIFEMVLDDSVKDYIKLVAQ